MKELDDYKAALAHLRECEALVQQRYAELKVTENGLSVATSAVYDAEEAMKKARQDFEAALFTEDVQ